MRICQRDMQLLTDESVEGVYHLQAGHCLDQVNKLAVQVLVVNAAQVQVSEDLIFSNLNFLKFDLKILWC